MTLKSEGLDESFLQTCFYGDIRTWIILHVQGNYAQYSSVPTVQLNFYTKRS